MNRTRPAVAFEVGGAPSRAPRAASRSWKGQEADSPAGLPEGNAALLGPWSEPNEMAPDFRLPALLVLKPLCLWSFVTAAEGNENYPLQACPPPPPGHMQPEGRARPAPSASPCPAQPPGTAAFATRRTCSGGGAWLRVRAGVAPSSLSPKPRS